MNYNTIIIGATFAGIGASFARRGNTLIVESRPQVGYEFINSYNPGFGYQDTKLSSAEAMSLKNELLERNILSSDGLMHVPALGPVLYSRIKDHEILLTTCVKEIRKTDGGFEVEVYNSSGFGVFTADEVIDTRFGEVLSKSINAVLFNSGNELPRFVNGNRAEYVKGGLKGEIILKLQVDAGDGYAQAREKLHRFWQNRSADMKDWTIAAVADCFDVKTPKGPIVTEKGYTLLPSCAYSNPLEAFEAGFQFMSGGIK